MVSVALAFAVLDLTGPVPDLGFVLAAFGQVIGPAVGGFVVAGIGPGWAIGVDSLSYASSALFLVALRLPRREPLPQQPFFHDLLDGWREFTARTWVWSNLAFIGIGNM